MFCFVLFSKSITLFSEKQVLAFVILHFMATCKWQKAFFLSYLEGITTYHEGISVKTGVLGCPYNPSTRDAERGGFAGSRLPRQQSQRLRSEQREQTDPMVSICKQTEAMHTGVIREPIAP